jgi:lysyl-tRNA synthetase class 1
MGEERNPETVQTVGTDHKTLPFEPLRDWFKAIYEVALGTRRSASLGSPPHFGCSETAVLIRTALSGAFMAVAQLRAL